MKIARANMRFRRLCLGLTYKELGEEIGVHPNTVRNWEQGRNAPMGENLNILCKLLRTTPEYLLAIGDEPDTNVPVLSQPDE